MSVHQEIRALRPSGPFGLESVAQRGAAQKNDSELLSAAAAHGKTGTIERVRLGKLPEAFLHLEDTLFMITHVATEEPDKYHPSSKGYCVRRMHAPRGQGPPQHLAPATPPPPRVRPAGRARTTPAPGPSPPQRTQRRSTYIGPAPTRPGSPQAAAPAPATRRVTGAQRIEEPTPSPVAAARAQGHAAVKKKKKKMIFFMVLGVVLFLVILALASSSGSSGESDPQGTGPGQNSPGAVSAEPNGVAEDVAAQPAQPVAATAAIHFESTEPVTAGTPVTFQVRGVSSPVLMVMWTFGQERIQDPALENQFAFAEAGTHAIEAVVVLQDGPPLTLTSEIVIVAAEVRIGSDETMTLPRSPGDVAPPTVAVTPLAGEWVARIEDAQLTIGSSADAVLLAAGVETEEGVDCSAIWGFEATVHAAGEGGQTSVDLSSLRPGTTSLCVVSATLSGREIADASEAVGHLVRVDPSEERLLRKNNGSLGVNPDVGQMTHWAQARSSGACPSEPGERAETHEWPAPSRTFDRLEAEAAERPICFWGKDALGNWTAPLTFRGRVEPVAAPNGQTCPGRPSWSPTGDDCMTIRLSVNGTRYTRVEFGGGDIILPSGRDRNVTVCPARVGRSAGDRFEFRAHMSGTPFTRCGPWSFHFPGAAPNEAQEEVPEPVAPARDPAAERAGCLARCRRDHPSGIARSNCVNRCD